MVASWFASLLVCMLVCMLVCLLACLFDCLFACPVVWFPPPLFAAHQELIAWLLPVNANHLNTQTHIDRDEGTETHTHTDTDTDRDRDRGRDKTHRNAQTHKLSTRTLQSAFCGLLARAHATVAGNLGKFMLTRLLSAPLLKV